MHGIGRERILRGRHYGTGDAEIWNCANRSEHPGGLGDWVRIDQNRRIETTIEQVQQVLMQLARAVTA